MKAGGAKPTSDPERKERGAMGAATESPVQQPTSGTEGQPVVSSKPQRAKEPTAEVAKSSTPRAETASASGGLAKGDSESRAQPDDSRSEKTSEEPHLKKPLNPMGDTPPTTPGAQLTIGPESQAPTEKVTSPDDKSAATPSSSSMEKPLQIPHPSSGMGRLPMVPHFTPPRPLPPPLPPPYSGAYAPPPKLSPGASHKTGPSNSNGEPPLSGSFGVPPPRTFTIPPRTFPFRPPMRPPSSVPGPPFSSTGPPVSRALLVPVHTGGGPLMSLVPDSQTRSYSMPLGPSVTPPLGVSRTHSWPPPGVPVGFRPPGPPGTLDPSFPYPMPPFQGPRPRGRRQPQTLRISKWVNPIPPDPDDGQQQTGEQELATKMLQIQSKRFYIDVKQNRRGRFMKVAEIGADGRRNQVFLALSTAAEFRDHLSMFSEFYSNLGPPNPDTLPEDGKLKSETMVKDNRRYYLDLKENSRGRFLRVSQTIARGGPRCQIAIPAQGMIEFRDALQELLEEFGTDDGGYKGELPEGRHMRVENKNFYFDIGQNNRGIYMRISEVKTNFRTAITIPEKSWSRFRDIFADYVDKMKEGGEKSTSESNK